MDRRQLRSEDRQTTVPAASDVYNKSTRCVVTTPGQIAKVAGRSSPNVSDYQRAYGYMERFNEALRQDLADVAEQLATRPTIESVLEVIERVYDRDWRYESAAGLGIGGRLAIRDIQRELAATFQPEEETL